MTNTQNTAAADLISDLRLILLNQPELVIAMRQACRESVENDDAATNDVPRAYLLAVYNGDTQAFNDCAGLAVRDAVLDLIEAEVGDGFTYDLITQRLDLHNQQVWAEVAASFMPEPSEFDDED